MSCGAEEVTTHVRDAPHMRRQLLPRHGLACIAQCVETAEANWRESRALEGGPQRTYRSVSQAGGWRVGMGVEWAAVGKGGGRPFAWYAMPWVPAGGKQRAHEGEPSHSGSGSALLGGRGAPQLLAQRAHKPAQDWRGVICSGESNASSERRCRVQKLWLG